MSREKLRAVDSEIMEIICGKFTTYKELSDYPELLIDLFDQEQSIKGGFPLQIIVQRDDKTSLSIQTTRDINFRQLKKLIEDNFKREFTQDRRKFKREIARIKDENSSRMIEDFVFVQECPPDPKFFSWKRFWNSFAISVYREDKYEIVDTESDFLDCNIKSREFLRIKFIKRRKSN